MDEYPAYITELAARIVQLPEEDQFLISSLLDFLQIWKRPRREAPDLTD